MIRQGNDRRSSKLAAIALIAVAFTLGAVEPTRAASMSDALTAYARGDYAAAAKRLTRLAAAGDARAQGLLGFMYEYGHGVPQDYVIAVMWYMRGAEQGDPARAIFARPDVRQRQGLAAGCGDRSQMAHTGCRACRPPRTRRLYQIARRGCHQDEPRANRIGPGPGERMGTGARTFVRGCLLTDLAVSGCGPR